jgi:hypothetical protein
VSLNGNLKLQLSWRNANRDCRAKGMRLVSIESQEEDAAISSFLSIIFLYCIFGIVEFTSLVVF